jgi:hypothetical protein
MGKFALLNGISTMLASCILAAESLYGAIKGQGALKKAAVMGAVEGIVNAVIAQSGNSVPAEDKPALLAYASAEVDLLCTAYNAFGTFKGMSTTPIILDNDVLTSPAFPVGRRTL